MIGRPAKVSVIVPVYNVEKYLSTCLLSCINQTLYDIEIVCVNDGSTDNSLSVLEEFARHDNRIKVVNKANGGLSSARNAGIRNSCGEIIMFLDSDDYLAPEACDRVWRETLEEPTDIVIFGAQILPETPRASDWHYDVLNVRTHRCWDFSPAVLFSEPNAKPFVWRQAFSRKLFEKHGLEFDERVKYGEDMVFQMEIFPHAKNFAFIADQLYYYRWYREGSLMQSYRADLDERIRQHLGFLGYITEYWKKQGWLERYGKEYTQWVLEFIVPDSRNSEAQCSSEHLTRLDQLLKEYSLEPHLDDMPKSVQNLVDTLKRGRAS